MRKILSILSVALVVVSCHQSPDNEILYDKASIDGQMVESSPQTAAEPSSKTSEIVKQEVNKKKIVKDGRLNLKVDNITLAKRRIDSLVRENEGYYSNESFNNTDWESSYNLKIRIPVLNFEKFIAGVESGEGELIFKQIDARDVTDQFIDLETRLKNKKSYLTRYNALLNQAKSIKEILEVEEKIRILEEEIESTTGRLNYLNDLVDYSTLDLTISMHKDFKYNPAKRDKFSERLKQSLSRGWYGFVDFVLFILRLWPFLIILAIVLYLWRKLFKRKTKK